jgi:hypothetical protein
MVEYRLGYKILHEDAEVGIISTERRSYFIKMPLNPANFAGLCRKRADNGNWGEWNLQLRSK